MESLGFSTYSIISSAYKDSFVSFLPIWIPFVSSSCLIAVPRTPNTMVKRSGESEHPCLVPELRGNTFRFLPLSLILAGASLVARR